MEKAGVETKKLVDLADYQEGSIVSRTIVDKKTGTVTFFAFDKGQGLSEHTAPFDALVYLLDGEAEITISGKPRIERIHVQIKDRRTGNTIRSAPLRLW